MSIYEEVALADFRYDADALMYYYACPCGDLFEISLDELHDGEDVALCPSCSLKVRVLFDEQELPPLPYATLAGDADAALGAAKPLIASGFTDEHDAAASKAAQNALEISDDADD
jgi:diphthamide biosynthesis protein 3